MYILTNLSLTGDEAEEALATSNDIEKLKEYARTHLDVDLEWSYDEDEEYWAGIISQDDGWFAGVTHCRIDEIVFI